METIPQVAAALLIICFLGGCASTGKNSQYSNSNSLKKQKVTNIILFSNTPKKSLKEEGLSKKNANIQFKKHLNSVK